MGLFDTIVIENLKLKTPPVVKDLLKEAGRELPNNFQTKDLDNSMTVYYIDKNSQMYVDQYVETGKRIKRDNFWSNWTDNRSFLERLFYRIKNKSLLGKPTSLTVPEFKKVKKKYTGTHTFNFYIYEEIAGRYLDIEYKAEVIAGKVKKIDLVRYEIESISVANKRKAEREVFDKKIQESMEARRKFTSSWYYPVLREVYNPFVFFTRSTIQWVCQQIINGLYKWRGI